MDWLVLQGRIAPIIAPNCPQQIQELKMGAIERSFHWCSTPQQLMDNITRLTPIASGAMRPTSVPGDFKLEPETDAHMYPANCNELFNLREQLGDASSAATATATTSASTSSAPP